MASVPVPKASPSRRATTPAQASESAGGGREAARLLYVGGRRIVLSSPAMVALHGRLLRAAASPAPVLVLGETGSGKEWIARAVHEASERRQGPLEILNCGAIPQELIEAELFGTERGAFTGAVRTSAGIFERAHGGTVFLDELAELSAQAQVALLRVLDGQAFRRVGGGASLTPDVRVVAATHRDLREAVAAGRFREDLYYRLATVVLEVPPLRARREEIPLLARHFLHQLYERWGQGPTTLSGEALEHLSALPWPGNVRQLRSAIEAAALDCEGQRLELADLERTLRSDRRGFGTGAPATPTRLHTDAARSESEACELESAGGDLRSQVRDFERRLIRKALAETHGNQRQAAARLGLPVRTLVHKLGRHGITRGACRDR
ncbi:MAG: sigma-54 dependent transcriptional regulator [Myxococcales bacterium]|nr:sigma-54 dependent transcriptional regulator [Myxococcales bacterium]